MMRLMHKLLKDIGYFVGKKDELGFPLRYDDHGKRVEVPARANYDWSSVKEPATRQQIIDWVKALRSGNYNQIDGSLKTIRYNDDDEPTGMCHCCLGVFADINNDIVTNAEDTDYTYYEFKAGADSILGSEFYNEKTYQYDHTYFNLPGELQKKYYMLNDEQGKSFNEIADVIEKDFGLVPTS